MDQRTAPFYSIPSRHIVSVEHPAIIKNVDKAIDTLQGDHGISKILSPPKADTPANLVLRPEDAMARPVPSISSPCNNVLLKVTVPKRTGRKRKRGSNEPFTGVAISTSSTAPKRHNAQELLRTLRDNTESYQIEAVGSVNRTHVFRGMPDFVFSTAGSPFTNRFREQILSFDYEKMKEFDLNMEKGATSNVDIIPPPSFSHGEIPFSYIYRQNPTVRRSIDISGKITTVNTQQAAKVLTHLVPADIPSIPTQPRDNVPALETQEKTIQETVAAVRALFSTRPAWTRRGLRNSLPSLEQRYALRHAVPYIGYIFRSGPWRDAIIKFGHDPRTSPSYRMYQTVMFRILQREPEVARDGYGGRRHNLPRPSEAYQADPETNTMVTDSHIFTGKPPMHRDGRLWMFCDIADPLLTSILCPSSGTGEGGSSPPAGFLRDKCDPVSDGWFGSGTLAKMKTIMRHKVLGHMEGRMPEDVDFVRVLDLPDHADVETFVSDFSLDPAVASSKELQLATEVRAAIKGAQSWRERAAANAGREKDGSRSRGGRPGDSKRGKKVQWQDTMEEEEEDDDEEEEEEDGDESESESEEMYQAEIEAEAAAAVEATTAAERERESDIDMEDVS
ncbi:tau 95 subunit of transcription factor TFIIIC [Aspergillus nanangensis]|uniref:Tau 95 subunit of transcription factor TFIIIC n=1 Tax=Aspergillus nanangensis TaxID=2582783 RepID=A0AAD4CRR1_ASPNN|nr:tau 95 subunit of transcription factor TFIIIC [Aspergillus nanangensis]